MLVQSLKSAEKQQRDKCRCDGSVGRFLALQFVLAEDFVGKGLQESVGSG